MSLLTTLIVEDRHILFYRSRKASYSKLERLSIPNLDHTEKIGNVVIK